MRCLPLADDCGVSNANTESIFQCIDAGSLRGTSILACGAALDKAINGLAQRLHLNPGLRVGVHLNLLEGHCTANPASVANLVNGQGKFKYSLGKLYFKLLRACARQKSRFNEQIATEWQAQIELIQTKMRLAYGKNILFYLDGHQHVHAIPALRPALDKILNQHQFIHVRVPDEPRYYVPAPPALQLVGTVRRELLACWGKSLRAYLAKRKIPTPNYFIGAFASGCMNIKRLEAGLNKLSTLAKKDDLVEIMFHPGGYEACELQEIKLAMEINNNTANNKNDNASNSNNSSNSEKKDVFYAFYAAPERSIEKNMLLSTECQKLFAQHAP